MAIIFWICWLGEILAAVTWLTNGIRSPQHTADPLVVCCIIYLFAAVAIRVDAGASGIAMGMVLIPALPMVLLLCVTVISRFNKSTVLHKNAVLAAPEKN